MAKGEIVTRLGCPDVCGYSQSFTGIGELKYPQNREGVPAAIIRAATGNCSEAEEFPILQTRDGEFVGYNNYDDPLFPSCEFAVEDARKPEIWQCPNRDAIVRAAASAQAAGYKYAD